MQKATVSTRGRDPGAFDYPHHVVIIGGGFGGLNAARHLGSTDIRVTLIDRRNFHLFQPLLYQVATGGLSAANICAPLRSVLRRYQNIRVILGEVVGFDLDRHKVLLQDDEIDFDSLVIATGSTHHYFGHDQWGEIAPGLKTIEDASNIRQRLFLAFEMAEREIDPAAIRQWLTFLVVGGGPTGVELAGAIAEIARHTLRCDFRTIDPASAKVILAEGGDVVLPQYPLQLSKKAERQLKQLGVTVWTRAMVTDVAPGCVTVKRGSQTEEIATQTVFWAAGVKASELGPALAKAAHVETDRMGRIVVNADLSMPGFS